MPPGQPLYHSYVRNRTLGTRGTYLFRACLKNWRDAYSDRLHRRFHDANRAGEFCFISKFSLPPLRKNSRILLKLQSSNTKIYSMTRSREPSVFFSSDCSAEQSSMVHFVRACVRLRWCSRVLYADIACTYTRSKGGFTRHEDRAGLLHECLFVRCAHADASLRSCAREFTSCVLLARKRSVLILVRFTADRR